MISQDEINQSSHLLGKKNLKLPSEFNKTQNHFTMERRDFITAGVFAGLSFSMMPTGFAEVFSDDKPKPITNKIKRVPLRPFLLQAGDATLAPGERTRPVPKVRFSNSGGQFSSAEVTIAPKIMGPAPHIHKAMRYLRLKRAVGTFDHTAFRILFGMLRMNLRPFLTFTPIKISMSSSMK
jgi:hypothetical protein